MKKFKIYSGLKTPDGTVLHSSHRHDYVTHNDKNSKEYVLDGGVEYVRCSGHGDEELIEVFSDEPFEKVRQYCYRLGYGKYGAKDYGKFRITFLDKMTDGHLEALMTYCKEDNQYLPLYKMEIEYRKQNNIKIDE
jgi:hypothetical protein